MYTLIFALHAALLSALALVSSTASCVTLWLVLALINIVFIE
jgi:hypothetical protein